MKRTNTPTNMPSMDLLPLPVLYNTMQDVTGVDWNGFPSAMKHRPFLYVAREPGRRASIAVLSPHGAASFYALTGTDFQNDPLRVGHTKTNALNGPGCMIHTFRDVLREPTGVEATVSNNGSSADEVVRTTHADDASEPPGMSVFQGPAPICNVEFSGPQAVVHCMLYMEGSGFQLDRAAAAQAVWTRQVDGQGQLVEWRLMVPVKPGSQFKLQYATFDVAGSIGIGQGEVVRLKMASLPGSNGTGRSFAFQWP
ncbi:MAG: hypothetical protein KBH07_03290 [Flavobacteriales bacterium]|nr:hypothetical protein [Flavobacteriales bacterium]MBP9081295.1 hypothetical protein [Flavobacteriales bacterium]